jgi:hypothetical protein
MKQFLKHTLVIALAFLTIGATMSFTINEHLCGGVKVSFSIGVAAENCGMEIDNQSTTETTMQQTPCCDDITTFIQGQDELPSQDVHTKTLAFIKAFVYSYVYILSTEDQEQAVYKLYEPPPLIKDIQLIDETFLI